MIRVTVQVAGMTAMFEQREGRWYVAELTSGGEQLLEQKGALLRANDQLVEPLGALVTQLFPEYGGR